MRKKIAILLIVILFFCLGIWGIRQIGQMGQKEISLAGHKLQVEIADTDARREQGLSDRKSLCSECGLLFVYDTPGIYSFWMRKMHFDIDVIWILGDKVVDITYSAKKPSAEEFDSPKTTYQPKSPADKILEVNSGWAKKNNILVGDEIKIII